MKSLKSLPKCIQLGKLFCRQCKSLFLTADHKNFAENFMSAVKTRPNVCNLANFKAIEVVLTILESSFQGQFNASKMRLIRII